MPANKNALMRYRAIDRCISNKHKPFPSMQGLIDACKEALYEKISESAIQKDLKAMKFDESLGYIAPIKFDRQKKGYYYSDPNYSISSINLNDEELDAVGFASEVLQQFKDVGIFKFYSNAIEKIFQAVKLNKNAKNKLFNNVIYFEKAPDYKGSEHIQTILSNILNQETIDFEYYSYDRKKSNWYCLHPYVLKEYRNRWYVIGMHNVLKEIRTFALDRILELKTGNIKWDQLSSFDSEKFFHHSFGIYYGDQVEDVVLSFTPDESQYIRSQPIHSTQKVLIDNKSEYRIRIKVFIEYDLIMFVRSCGERIKVIEPQHLKEKMIDSYKKALNNY
ncbi:MAG: WYL domain-containing protein [Bacteroidota bacterium]